MGTGVGQDHALPLASTGRTPGHHDPARLRLPIAHALPTAGGEVGREGTEGSIEPLDALEPREKETNLCEIGDYTVRDGTQRAVAYFTFSSFTVKRPLSNPST